MEVDWTTNLGRYSGGKTLEERIEAVKSGFDKRDEAFINVYDHEGNFLSKARVNNLAIKFGVSCDTIHRHADNGKLFKKEFFFDYTL